MFCPKCGSNVPDSTKFCPTCGALLADEAQQAPATEPQPQPQYQPQQPVYQAAPADNNPAALKVSQFFWLDFLTGIPLVGFILTLVWGFGGDVNENKRNYCSAKLVWLLIGIAVTVIFTIIAVAGGGLAALIYEQY